MKVVYGIVCMVLAGLLLETRHENLEMLPLDEAVVVTICAIVLLSMGVFLIILGIAGGKSKWLNPACLMATSLILCFGSALSGGLSQPTSSLIYMIAGLSFVASIVWVLGVWYTSSVLQNDRRVEKDGDSEPNVSDEAEPEVRPVVEEELDEDDDSSESSEEQPVLVSDDLGVGVVDSAETETAVVVESKLEKNRRKSTQEAREIASEKWKVVRVVVAYTRSQTEWVWRALIMMRSLDGSSSLALEIFDSHRHYYDYFALSEGEVVEFVCDGENFETGPFSTTIPEDFLRVVLPFRLTDEVKRDDEAEGVVGVADETPIEDLPSE